MLKINTNDLRSGSRRSFYQADEIIGGGEKPEEDKLMFCPMRERIPSCLKEWSKYCFPFLLTTTGHGTIRKMSTFLLHDSAFLGFQKNTPQAFLPSYWNFNCQNTVEQEEGVQNSGEVWLDWQWSLLPPVLKNKGIQEEDPEALCYGLNAVPPNSHFEALASTVTVFGNRVFTR